MANQLEDSHVTYCLLIVANQFIAFYDLTVTTNTLRAMTFT